MQSDDNCKWQWKVEDKYVGNIIYWLFLHIFFYFVPLCIVSFTYNYRSYYTRTFSVLIFVYSLCLYSYILHSNGHFDSHLYISVYIFTTHLLYNYCILIRCSYFIVFTYVVFIVSYYFFLYLIMNWSLWVFIAWNRFSCRLLYKVILYVSDMCQLCLYIFTCVCL